MRQFALAPSILLPRDSVVGIFDVDTATVSRHTRDFLRRAQASGAVVAAGEDLPQAFVVADEKVYLSPHSSANLAKKLLTNP